MKKIESIFKNEGGFFLIEIGLTDLSQFFKQLRSFSLP